MRHLHPLYETASITITHKSCSTGRYKVFVLLGPLFSTTCFVLLLLRWQGHTSFAESFYIALGGCGTGIATAAVFVFLSASTKRSDAAIAGGGFFLSGSLGEVTGLSVHTAILQVTLRRTLEQKLVGMEGSAEVSGRFCFH